MAVEDAPSASAGSASSDAAPAELVSAAEDGDLRSSLAGLSRLATGQLKLSDVLTRVAQFAVRAIPGADGAGLTLIEQGRSDTIVFTAPFVHQVDDIQYGIGQGPCITAAAEARTVRSGSLVDDPQWPRFGPRVARLGVQSALSLPLLTTHGAFGAMNIYAHDRDVFDERAALIGELFAVPAAIAVQNAQVLAQTQRLAVEFQTALVNRAVIDQAIGIVRARAGCTADEAFDRLRQMSQRENTKLHTVAQTILDESVRRARARHQET